MTGSTGTLSAGEKPSAETHIAEIKPVTELTGKLQSDLRMERLMRSVLENDADLIEQGNLIEAALDGGIGSFSADLMFENIVKDFWLARQLYGAKLIKLLTGYESDYVEKNIRIPEFKKELKERIKEKIKKLGQHRLVSKDGTISESGIDVAAVVLYAEELDRLISKNTWGEHVSEKKSVYGTKGGVKPFRRADRYRDIALKKSIKTALRRGRTELVESDLQSFERFSTGRLTLVYAIDASASMKGEKLTQAKKAGVALAYKALTNKDEVGLLVFGDQVTDSVMPCRDFVRLLRAITTVRASRQTDIAKTILTAIQLFGSRPGDKHLILLTDVLPTVGDQPETETLNAAATAANTGITISLIGIGSTSRGAVLAEKIAEIGKGKFYVARNIAHLDTMVLEDYQGLRG